MSMLRAPKVALDSMFGFIVERLRCEAQSGTHEPLPARWIELIHHLDEQERTKMDTKFSDQDAGSRPKKCP